tara:strand:- start:1157 stop:2704 length:1548 start_codon:yes stop_codon:yes gene_type:complete
MKTNILSSIIILLIVGCNPQAYRLVNRISVDPQDHKLLHPSSPFLKTHMKDGTVYVFDKWEIFKQYDDLGKEMTLVIGDGTLLSINRNILKQGQFKVPIDSIVIMETNKLTKSGSVTAMTLVTGLSLFGTGLCALNPKACFGSCPTFYVNDGNNNIVQAEGFSSSIAPSLEATDIDMLYHASNSDEIFQVEMKNEAYETHVIDYVDLLLFPKSDEERIFFEGNDIFWKTNEIISPYSCSINHEDCLNKINKMDDLEWYSVTDSFNLAKKEIIEIEFNNIKEGDYGLIIGARQSLLSTFIFYQALSYMGKNVGEWLAMTERGEIPHGEIFNVLGGIEILIQNEKGKWIKWDEMKEMGPIATDIHMIKLPAFSQSSKSIKLRLAKGNWRINYIALASLNEKLEPIVLKPSSVYYDSKYDDEALNMLSISKEKLVTLPGDVYTINYEIPSNELGYEYFLKSRGYYLEWIRDSWIEEENLSLLVQMNFRPKKTLKDLAPIYKEIEANMENVFWNSKYEK